MTILSREQPSAAPFGGQRRVRQGWLKAADLGGGFNALPAGLTITSDVLNVAGFNGAMAWISSTAGGTLSYTISWMPGRVTDAILLAGGAAVAGSQIVSFGKQGGTSAIAPAWVFMILSWANQGAGTLSDFQISFRGKP